MSLSLPDSFLSGGRLWLLLAVAALALVYVLAQRRRKVYAVRFTQLDLLDKVAPRGPGWRRHLPAAAFLAAMALLVLAFARPQDEVRVPRERATLVIALDVSISMQATDVEPSRFEAAKESAQSFVGDLPAGFNVGLVTFSQAAQVIVPPTTEREAVLSALEGLELRPSTAIGEAVFSSLDAITAFDNGLEETDEGPPPARIVLLSDGSNTAGRDIASAARAATEAQVPVSTIAYGTQDGVVTVNGEEVRVPVDGPQLETLADDTGGSFYEAESGEELGDVYDDIGSSVGYRTEVREVSARFVGAALIAALLAAAGSLLWFSRLP